MIEIRIHGRGGQGAVVASKVLAEAAFIEGHYVQAYPQYGVERRDAPVVAFTRVAEPGDEFFVRQDILEPDHLIILDPTLLLSTNVIAGLKKGGWIVVNTPDPPDSLAVPLDYRVATVNASDIAVKHGIGSRTQPVVNTTVLGAFVRVTGLVNLKSLLTAIEEEAPTKTEENKAAATEAYENVKTGGKNA
ncbi:MAG: 2-oxoacid:acceptor oxidoreductase family protein [Candidatus Hydrothermia bacterium]